MLACLSAPAVNTHAGVVLRRHECPTALTEMRELHYTYLNRAYNRVVLDQWELDGCYEEMHRHMGYRLALTQVP